MSTLNGEVTIGDFMQTLRTEEGFPGNSVEELNEGAVEQKEVQDLSELPEIPTNEIKDIKDPIDPKETSEEKEEESEGEESSNKDGQKTKDGGPTSTKETSSPYNNKVYSLLAKDFVDSGILSSDEGLDEVQSMEQLKERLDYELEERANLLLEQTFSAETLKVLDAIQAGVPIEDVVKIHNSNLEYSAIKDDDLLENEQLQEKIIKTYERLKGSTEEEIDELLDNLADKSKLAVRYKKNLIDRQNKEIENKAQAEIKRQESAKKDRENRIREIENFIDNNKSIINGIPLNKKQRADLKNWMLKPAGYNNNGQPYHKMDEIIASNPLQVTTAINYIAMITNGFKDFKALTNYAKTNAIKDIESALNDRQGKSLNTPATGNAGSLINELENLYGKR